MRGKKNQRPDLDRVHQGGKCCGMEAGQVSPDSRARVLESEVGGHSDRLIGRSRLSIDGKRLGQVRCTDLVASHHQQFLANAVPRLTSPAALKPAD